MSKKIYVLDTNVCLSDSKCLTMFGTHDVVLPIKVLEEIDNNKKRQDSVGNNARAIIRYLDSFRTKGSLYEGVRIAKGKGVLSVKVVCSEDLPENFDIKIPDNEIIAVALNVKKDNPDKKVFMVTKDINMRVKCDSLNLLTEDYQVEQVVKDTSELYTGFTTHLVDDPVIDKFYQKEEVFLEKTNVHLFPNQFLMLVSNSDNKKTALARFVSYSEPLDFVEDYKKQIFGIKPRNKEQVFALNLLMDPDVPVVTLIGKAGTGKTLAAIAAGLFLTVQKGMYSKLIVSRPIQPMGRDLGYLPGPQPLDAKVLTPNGWTIMGKIKVGDYVIGADGKPTKVIKVFPHGEKEIYKVSTSDGTSTECCIDHLWYTRTAEERKRGKEGNIRTTREIIDSLKTKKEKMNHFLPRVEPVEFEKQELPVPPYLLGCLIGDGSLSDSVALHNMDKELIERCEKEIKHVNKDLYIRHRKNTISYTISQRLYNNKPAKKIKVTNVSENTFRIYNSVGVASSELNINKSTIEGYCRNKRAYNNYLYEFLPLEISFTNSIKNEIKNLGLLKKRAWEKFIPETYKYSSINDRIDLLRGLMDTDGTVKKNGEASFTTTSLQLAKDVQELVRSLGGRATIRSRNRINKTTKIRERNIITRRISYEFTISLPNEINPFYISRKAERYSSAYIHGMGIESIKKVGIKEVQCIQVESDKHLYVTDGYILTHNSLEEKLRPWIAPIQDNLEFLMKHEQQPLEKYMDEGIIELEALTYIRGRSISNAFIIIDEAQNLSAHELKTILTRVGENTKIVLTGDIEQIDNAYLDETSSGLTHAVEKLKDYDLAGHVTLTKGERSKVATLASKVF